MKRLISQGYQTVWQLIVGRHSSPLQRMHLAFLFFAALVGLASAVFNLALALTSPHHNGALLVFSSIVIWMWYRARWHGEARRMAWWLCLLTLFVILPLNWLFNQGMQGPTLMFFLMTAAYALGVMPHDGWQRRLVLMGFVVMPLLLLMLENANPHWIAPYSEQVGQALDLGVSYLLNVAILIVIVSGHMGRIQREQQRSASYAAQLETLARLDSLTGLLNHGAFHAELQSRLPDIAKGKPYVLLSCDLDYFKHLNDTYGHPYGDEVIRTFAGLLRQTAEEAGGVAGRCGGEEFAVLLSTGLEQAKAFDRQLRVLCHDHCMRHGAIRFSSGLASAVPGETIPRWTERVDRALYTAKAAGRNRLAICDTSISTLNDWPSVT